MKAFSEYSLEDGSFTGVKISGPGSETFARKNTRPGFGLMPGDHDRQSRRVDLVSKLVVRWQPPRPSQEHQWNDKSERWEKRADVVRRERQRIINLARIQELEGKQHRRVREILAKDDPILGSLEREIEELRALLSDETETSEP